MEEVSIAAAYNAHIINQTTEEDLLASLVADSRLRAALPNQKQREMKRKEQSHRESEPPLTIESYKICSELSSRLETEEVRAKAELGLLKVLSPVSLLSIFMPLLQYRIYCDD
ncbi:hypothetical protein SKAU_G00319180 [Synaphobranchus kaupii]|uniref:Uncharacterized protein n=1 Tax=Synaphobranchus kaupii TaxID=118154 RepID=A0A9Q1ENB3_SYNKA|nr:hypothetical protein SKAU_G00319180 [Synaphobranchus kaupii]